MTKTTTKIEEFEVPENLRQHDITRIAKEGRTIVIQWQDRHMRFDIFKTWRLTLNGLHRATKDILSDKVIEKLEMLVSKMYIKLVENEGERGEHDDDDDDDNNNTTTSDAGNKTTTTTTAAGQETKPKPVELTEELTREVAASKEIGEILSTSIKRDDTPKLITFYAMLLAQTNEDQLNIGFQSESSAGKSYIPIELAAYFPKEEVSVIASASPTAFFHDSGVWDKDEKVLVVDLKHKNLVFLDQPHFQLLERLRPLLSHDMKELKYKITDKNQKHGLRTKNVLIKGYPSVVFCTTKMDPDEQEKTRMILLSPSVDQEKLKESIRLMSLRKGNPEEYSEQISQDPRRTWLMDRIRAIRQTGIRNVIIPNHEKDVCERFLKEHAYLMPRHQRDFPRIMCLIKGHALLNCFQREKVNDDTIIANKADIDAGFELYRSIQLSNELGISPYLFQIYSKVFVPLLGQDIRVSREDVLRQYHKVFHKTLSPETLKREIIPQLETVGLIVQEPDPEDKRRLLIRPTVSTPIISEQMKSTERGNSLNDNNNRGEDSGVVVAAVAATTTEATTKTAAAAATESMQSWLIEGKEDGDEGKGGDGDDDETDRDDIVNQRHPRECDSASFTEERVQKEDGNEEEEKGKDARLKEKTSMPYSSVSSSQLGIDTEAQTQRQRDRESFFNETCKKLLEESSTSPPLSASTIEHDKLYRLLVDSGKFIAGEAAQIISDHVKSGDLEETSWHTYKVKDRVESETKKGDGSATMMGVNNER